jgi:hypothetical protein
VNGIAVDRANGFVRHFFTQMLVKTGLQGSVLGTVTGLTGHLGDLDLVPEDGRACGSLEYRAQKACYLAEHTGTWMMGVHGANKPEYGRRLGGARRRAGVQAHGGIRAPKAQRSGPTAAATHIGEVDRAGNPPSASGAPPSRTGS